MLWDFHPVDFIDMFFETSELSGQARLVGLELHFDICFILHFVLTKKHCLFFIRHTNDQT